MLRPENGPLYKLFTKLFGKGANTDLEKEFLPEGVYYDAQNMRPASVEGHAGSINKIGGEELLYSSDIPGASGYVCIGACVVSGRRVEFWAHPDPDFPPLLRINGVVMAQSPNIPYVYDRPLQFGDVSNCTGGVIYPADGFSVPMFWDIPAIEEAFANNEQTYFSGFSLEANTTGLPFNPQPPRFRTLLGIGDGCPAGQHSIAVRGRTMQGDVTQLSLPTPLTPVPQVWDQPTNNAYPGGRNTGGETDAQNPTPYHLQYEYRLDNVAGYTELEWVLLSFNDGQGLNGPGATKIVGRFPVQSGFTSIINFVYPRDSNVSEDLAPDDLAVQQMNILAPKAVQYVDNRVVYGNFQTGSRLADLQFGEVDGSTYFWSTKRLTTRTPTGEVNSGHTDPYHATYNKSALRGGRYKIGVMPVDGFSAFAPVVPFGDSDIQAPNRRDPKFGRGLTYSTDGIPAATTDCQGPEPVNNTYEAFEQGVFQKGTAINPLNVIAASGNTPYNPWRPTSPTDGQTSGYNIKPISARITDTPGTTVTDTGRIWAPRYHSLGIGINSIQNIPSWARALAIMRTEEAGRVVMQGIGSYRLFQNPVSLSLPVNKSINEVVFYSKDADSAVVPQTVLEDIQNNPQNYRIQVVSPLGFYSETYGYWCPPQAPDNGLGNDTLIYAGIQHDEGQVNVGEPAAGGMGVNPGPTAPVPPGNYTGFGVWRSNAPGAGLPWQEGDNDGNTLLQIDAFEPVVEGRGTYYRLKTDGFFYAYQSTNDQIAFDNGDVRNFHEPYYVMNIIRVGAEVPDLNAQPYKYTGEVILPESCVGITTSGVQAFRLLNERLEDVQGQFSTEYRYVYIRTPNTPERAWVCFTNNATLPTATVLADIAANGFWVAPDGTNVYGIYEAYVAGPTGNLEPGLEYVVFGGLGQPVPPTNSRVIAKYNDQAPIIAFGFDRWISPCIHAPLDRTFNASGDTTSMPFGKLPLPYPGFVRNTNYYMPDTGSSLQPQIIIKGVLSQRQLCVLWDAETLTPGQLDLFGSTPFSAFPRIHYVMRPYRDINYSSGSANGFWPQYDVDYPGEAAQFSSGGIHFLSLYNLDYARQGKDIGFEVPEDFEERTDFCNGLIASTRLDPLQQNSPGLRTFTTDNLFLISEENGEIKRLEGLNAGYLSLYGWTDRGVFKIPYNQSILVGGDANVIGTQSVDQFWPRQEIWLSRGQKGMPDEFWRLAVKAHAPTGQGDADSVFWADRVSVYRLTGDTISDIARNRYLSELSQVLPTNPGTFDIPMASMYNQKHDEYWFSTLPNVLTRTPRVFVFSARNGEWTGKFTYDFDQYLCDQTTLLGMRDLQTYELDKGYIISGEVLQAWAETPYAPFTPMQSELVTFRVAPDKPDRIEIRDIDRALMFHTDEATQEAFAPGTGFLWIKYIDSWEQQVGRRNEVYDPDQKRVQGTLFYKRVISNTAVPFRMTFSQFNAKQIP